MSNPLSSPLHTICASVIQAATPVYCLENTLEKLEYLVRLAKERDDSQLALFPEAFIGGYPFMSNFGMGVGQHSFEGRNEFLRYYNAAIEIPSPAISRIEAVSKETRVFLVVPIIERDEGTLYCTAVYIDPEHGYVAKHRKIKPTGIERVIWGQVPASLSDIFNQGDGTTLPVLKQEFKSSGVKTKSVTAKISTAICWENYMPLLRTFIYSQGTQIYCAPTAGYRSSWQNTYTQEKDYPPDHTVADVGNRHPENVMMSGGSVIISPLGRVLAGPLVEGEGILTAELDLDDCVRGKLDLDVTGHYSRPDIFELKVKLSG